MAKVGEGGCLFYIVFFNQPIACGYRAITIGLVSLPHMKDSYLLCPEGTFFITFESVSGIKV